LKNPPKSNHKEAALLIAALLAILKWLTTVEYG